MCAVCVHAGVCTWPSSPVYCCSRPSLCVAISSSRRVTSASAWREMRGKWRGGGAARGAKFHDGNMKLGKGILNFPRTLAVKTSTKKSRKTQIEDSKSELIISSNLFSHHIWDSLISVINVNSECQTAAWGWSKRRAVTYRKKISWSSSS